MAIPPGTFWGAAIAKFQRIAALTFDFTCSAFFQRDTDAGRVHVQKNCLQVRIGCDGVNVLWIRRRNSHVMGDHQSSGRTHGKSFFR